MLLVFVEEALLRIRFHGRGGQGAKVASRIMGTAAFLEGYYAQDFPLYGAERRGAPIAAFTRISKEPVLERGIIAEPDIVIVMDETLLDDVSANPLSGVSAGSIVFINTSHSIPEVKERYATLSNVITLDITKISLEILGRPVLSSLASAVAARIAALKKASLKEAIEKEASEIITDRTIIEKNVEAAEYCFNAIEPVVAGFKSATALAKGSPVIPVPFEPAIISTPSINAKANTPLRKTGNWRLFRPVWDYDRCSKCMKCVALCPDGCISISDEGYPYADYDNCKGCMICANECPVDAISKVREVHEW